jgi:hypothetical protein
MKRMVQGLGGVVVVLFASTASAQAPASAAATYQSRCGNCHGAAMTGASAPAILTYVRYHTDAEVTAAIGGRHTPPLRLDDAELRQVLAGVRELAGTNPAMATGGFTGRRGGGAGLEGAAASARGAGPAREGGPARGAGSSPGPAASEPARGSTAVTRAETVTIKMADGRSRTGMLFAQSEVSAVLLENGRYVPLSKDGEVYRRNRLHPRRTGLTTTAV